MTGLGSPLHGKFASLVPKVGDFLANHRSRRYVIPSASPRFSCILTKNERVGDEGHKNCVTAPHCRVVILKWPLQPSRQALAACKTTGGNPVNPTPTVRNGKKPTSGERTVRRTVGTAVTRGVTCDPARAPPATHGEKRGCGKPDVRWLSPLHS